MNIFFYMVSVIQVIELLYSYKKTKIIFSIPNVFFVGVTLNFWLYLCNWSSLFVVECQPITYAVVGGCTLVVILYDILYLKRIVKAQKQPPLNLVLKIKRLRVGNVYFYFSTLVFILCLLCAAIENITSFGTLFPFLSGIDSHKNSAAILGTIWKALYPVGFFSFYFEYKQEGRKRLISYLILGASSVYLLIGGGSRFWSFISILSFVLFYFSSIKKKIKLKTVIIALLVGTLLFRVFLLMGMTRLQSSYTYMELIGYNGPFKDSNFSNVVGWFYGYFPYSFYNLNLTLKNILDKNLFTHGQFFIIPFLYVTKLYKFTSMDYTELALSVRIITNSSATVATAFFEFFADFKYLFFIPMALYVYVINKFQLKNTLFSQGCYAYCLVCLFLFNFYNVFSPGIPFTFIVLWYLYNRLLVVRRMDADERK